MGRTKREGVARYYIAGWAKRVGKRQRDLVRDTEIAKGFVSEVWNGLRDPGPESLPRFARAIGVPEYLLSVSPDSLVARAIAALLRMSDKQCEEVVETLEDLANSANLPVHNGDDAAVSRRASEIHLPAEERFEPEREDA